jgi:arylsulfatase A-like enzyme
VTERQSRWRLSLAWTALTLPLAPCAAVVYFLFEWLFFITKPSPVSALPAGERVRVLLASPLPLVLPLVALQAMATLVSLVAYPRTRLMALAPAAIGFGALLFLLLDNFTYTLLGFNSLTPWGFLGVLIYAALVVAAIAFAAWKLSAWMTAALARRHALVAGTVLSVFFFTLSVSAKLLPIDVDAAAPPETASAPPGVNPADGDIRRPNILFVGIDGVDADSLSIYGYERQTSPFLERFQVSNVGRTHGSLVALLTGRLPFTTRVTFPPTVLQGDDAKRSLLSVLEPLGYTTLQLGMRHYADAEDANLIGFHAANYRWQSVEQAAAQIGTIDQTDVFRRDVIDRFGERARRFFGTDETIDGFAQIQGRQATPYWSDDRRVETLERYFDTAREPWFVHAHLLDTHCCAYRPREMKFTEEPNLGKRAHDSVVAEADAHLGRLVTALRRTGRLDRTIVVVYSDHTSRWTTKGRVPLIMRFPEGANRGRVHANVQLADVAPTVLDFMGVPIPGWMDGAPVPSDDRIPRLRPIFGVSDVAKREAVAPYLSALTSAGPPNYGAQTVTVVLGAQWFELNLADGRVDSGRIRGYADADLRGYSVDDARALLAAQMESAGFKVAAR